MSKINIPVATLAQWTNKNPIVPKDLVVYEVNLQANLYTGSRSKLGDGITRYLDLPYLGSDKYEALDSTTVSLGGIEVGLQLQGKTWQQIIKQLLASPLLPQLTNVRANIDGTFREVTELRLGQSLPSSFFISFIKSHNANIKPNSTTVELSFPYVTSPTFDITGVSQISFQGGYQSSSPFELLLTVKGLSLEDKPFQSQPIRIRWNYDIYFGNSVNEMLTTENQVKSLNNNILRREFPSNFSFPSGGFSFLAIPQVLYQASTKFYELSVSGQELSEYPFNPQNTSTEDFAYNTSAPQVINITNAFGISLPYVILRSRYAYNTPATIKVI
jgi:hypothetical protein